MRGARSAVYNATLTLGLTRGAASEKGFRGSRFKSRGPDWLKKSDLLKSVQEVARGVSFDVSFSLLRSDFSSRGTTPTAQNTA